jgi:hypothetical protein
VFVEIVSIDKSPIVHQVDMKLKVLPADRNALPSIPVDGGHQLLLFGIDTTPARPELPKQIPKRVKQSAEASVVSEEPDGFDGLKLFPETESSPANAGKAKRRSVKTST